ncbi:ATP-dependent helicase [Thermodesulfobacteriota bacterium]
MNLNKEQALAASHVHGIASVVAVPGSGKTATMLHRICMLVNDHGVAPESILGLTFTRNAADEMRSRLRPILSEKSERVMLNTIHGFCFWLLKNEGQVFELLIGKEQIIFLKNVIRKLKHKDLPTGLALREINLAKANMIDVPEFRDLYDGDKTMLNIADVYERYDVNKQKKMLMDFDDLLVETNRLLTENETVCNRYKSSFSHIMVDEYQDTNPIQSEIIRLLVGDNSNESSYWVCGDDWQSIFSFSGASLGNILNFGEHFPESEMFILSNNYRSTPQILTCCQNLISHNVRKIEKILSTHNGDGEAVQVLESSSEETESLSIATEIEDLVKSRGYQYKDIAILVRANFQTRVIEECFSTRKIPYFCSNGLNFYDRNEIRVILDYLRLIAHPDSHTGDEALLSVLNVPNRYAGHRFKKELQDYATDKDMHLYPALKKIPIELPYIRHNMKDLRAFLDPLIEDAESLEPCELIQLIRSTLDYDRFITDEDIPSPDDTKIASLNQLQIAAAKHNRIDDFLLFTENFQGDLGHDKDGVQLMTIHRSKGLEYPCVFIMSMVEGILPSKKGDIEEERRICFVGISRAMQLLYLSTCQTYLGTPCKRSIFLDEMLGNK